MHSLAQPSTHSPHSSTGRHPSPPHPLAGPCRCSIAPLLNHPPSHPVGGTHSPANALAPSLPLPFPPPPAHPITPSLTCTSFALCPDLPPPAIAATRAAVPRARLPPCFNPRSSWLPLALLLLLCAFPTLMAPLPPPLPLLHLVFASNLAQDTTAEDCCRTRFRGQAAVDWTMGWATGQPEEYGR